MEEVLVEYEKAKRRVDAEVGVVEKMRGLLGGIEGLRKAREGLGEGDEGGEGG